MLEQGKEAKKLKMTLRWFGDDDNVKLSYIRQIPGVTGIVSALHHVPAGEVWPMEEIVRLKNTVEANGLTLEAIESVPLHEDIKSGLAGRDRYIENYAQTLRNLSKAGIQIVCYNFMPVFDWTRTHLHYALPDGSTALAYEESAAEQMNPLLHDFHLPAWDLSYRKEEMKALLERYNRMTEETLWDNLHVFLSRIIPVAEEVGIRMAIHPDDPPWPIFGLPRIITNQANIDRALNLVKSPSNGLTLCTGSLGAHPDNAVADMIRYFGERGNIHFAHVRNVRKTGPASFYESVHLSAAGDLDMVDIMKAFRAIGFAGPMRPDHGRMIWGETGRPGYGLYDRALGAVYLNGIWEALQAE